MLFVRPSTKLSICAAERKDGVRLRSNELERALERLAPAEGSTSVVIARR
jgi:hypothetical protein